MTSSAHVARRAGAAVVLLSTAALAAACGSATNNSSGSPASTAASSPAQPSGTSAPPSTTPTAPQTPPSSPAVPACSPSGLTAAVPSGTGGAAAGSTYYPLNLTNHSGKSCYLYGYPGVSFVTSPSGSQVGAAASRNPAVAPATVVLAPVGIVQ